MSDMPAVITTEYGLNPSQVAVIDQKTPPDIIFKRKGKSGKYFSYVPHNYVTRILNEAFSHAWSFEADLIAELSRGDELVVKGRLTVHGANGKSIVKEQFGQCEIPRDKFGKAGMTAGDALKGAGSDALRKCASLLGIALDLYGEHNDEYEKEEYNEQPINVTPQPQQPPPPKRISQRQQNFIFKLTASHIWTKKERQDITDWVLSREKPKTVDDGSRMIDRMKEEIAKREKAEKEGKKIKPVLFPCEVCAKNNINPDDPGSYRYWMKNGERKAVCESCYTLLLSAIPEDERYMQNESDRAYRAADKAEERARRAEEKTIEAALEAEA